MHCYRNARTYGLSHGSSTRSCPLCISSAIMGMSDTQTSAALVLESETDAILHETNFNSKIGDLSVS